MIKENRNERNPLFVGSLLFVGEFGKVSKLRKLRLQQSFPKSIVNKNSISL